VAAGLDAAPTLRRSDSLTKFEKTENNLKEKSEKRNRDFKRSDSFEKKSRDAKLQQQQSEYLRHLKSEQLKTDSGHKQRRLSTDVRHRRHNVKELKEKFEPVVVRENPCAGGGPGGGGGGKKSKRARGAAVKRRHTVGGTKDLSRVVALHKMLQQLQHPSQLHQLTSLPQLTLQQLLTVGEARERLGTSSPDLLTLLLQGGDERRLKEPWLLQPVLESHV
jgi:hypothetical protein